MRRFEQFGMMSIPFEWSHHGDRLVFEVTPLRPGNRLPSMTLDIVAGASKPALPKTVHRGALGSPSWTWDDHGLLFWRGHNHSDWAHATEMRLRTGRMHTLGSARGFWYEGTPTPPIAVGKSLLCGWCQPRTQSGNRLTVIKDHRVRRINLPGSPSTDFGFSVSRNGRNALIIWTNDHGSGVACWTTGSRMVTELGTGIAAFWTGDQGQC